MKPPRLLSPGELGLLWSMSTEQILELCRSGKLSHLKVNARVIRIPEVDAAIFYATAATQAKSGQLPVAADR